MTAFISWYLLLSALGLVSFPLVYRLFPSLPGRGAGFSRVFGLLTWGYLFWMLGSLGMLRNDPGGMIFAFALVVALSGAALRGLDRAGLRAWWSERRGHVLVAEVVFLAAFGLWTWIRALNPEITATEKPMELAFLNAILRSPAFPPNDPWLAGYSISYYYFGYVLVAMLAAASGTAAGVAFNLGVAAVFGLAAGAAYEIVAALLQRSGYRGGWRTGLLAVLGPVYVLVVSNLEGFLDMLHARGVFWRSLPEGGLESAFWRWLDLKDLVKAPAQPFSWVPQRFLWWWRASRVVNDVRLTGEPVEVIDEFPFFSFLLSDLHPHVLAIPFVLLAIGLALNHFMREDDVSMRIARYELPFGRAEFLVTALVMGALAFLNTWDFPIYVALFTACAVLKRAMRDGWGLQAVINGLGAGAALGIVGALLYFPFYVGFSSQAGGVLPNAIHPTRGAHLWVMFGTLFVPIFFYFVYEWRRERPPVRRALLWAGGTVFGLWLLSVLAVLAVGLNPEAAAEALTVLGAPDAGSLLRAMFERRFAGFGGWLTLLLLLSAALSVALRERRPGPVAFVAVAVLSAGLLITVPEFFYLRDLFGTRMNTVFKFYYQAWILLALAAAYGTARILQDWTGLSGRLASAGISLTLIMGLVYPALSLPTKTSGFNPTGGPNLDGTLHGAYLNGDDRAAVAWLMQAPVGVLLEAVGGSYSGAARIAAHSGQPNVLGWVFHQGQWRGGYEEVGSREADVARIYESGSWEEARELLDRYGVTYIYLGALERSTYRVSEGKFRRALPVLFEQGGVVIFGYGPSKP